MSNDEWDPFNQNTTPKWEKRLQDRALGIERKPKPTIKTPEKPPSMWDKMKALIASNKKDPPQKEDTRMSGRTVQYVVPDDMKNIIVTIIDSNGNEKSYTITNYIKINSGDTIRLVVK